MQDEAQLAQHCPLGVHQLLLGGVVPLQQQACERLHACVTGGAHLLPLNLHTSDARDKGSGVSLCAVVQACGRRLSRRVDALLLLQLAGEKQGCTGHLLLSQEELRH